MSESNKFTPGPWAVINLTGVFSELGAESGDGSKADPTDGWTIADCSAGCTLLNGAYVELGFAVQQANAKLIAAAPDLLEALDALVKINEDHNKSIQGVIGTPPGWNDSYLDAARKALSKARGQQ